MSIRRATRRGVTTAVHTDVQLLHPGALQDFIQHVRALLIDGELATAEVLWSSVYEVVHFPVPVDFTQEFSGLPPMRRVACTTVDCARCNQQLGGYQFPWVGLWTKAAAVVRPGATPDQAWEAYNNEVDTVDLLALERLASGYGLLDLIPVVWDRLYKQCKEAPGCATVEQLQAAFRGWQKGHDLWRDPAVSVPTRREARFCESKRSQRSLAVWIALLDEDPVHYLPAPCSICRQPTRRLCVDCQLGFCGECGAARADILCCEEGRCNDSGSKFVVPAVQIGESTGRFYQRLVRLHTPPQPGQHP